MFEMRGKKLREERRFKVFSVDLLLIGQFLQGGQWRFAEGTIPDGAILENASLDTKGLSTCFVFLHESFDPVPEGMEGPLIVATIERIYNEQ